MKVAFLFVFLAFFVSSFAMEIKAIEEKETSAVGAGHFDISILFDCNRTIEFNIKSEGSPVPAATVFVFYEERYTSLLGTGETDSSGGYAYKIIGDPKNMKNLFLVTVEKSGFRTKEAHFLLPDEEACIRQNKSAESPESPGQYQQNESQQIENKQENETGGAGQATEGQIQNNAGKEESEQNQTTDGGKTGENEKQKTEGALCAPFLLLPLAIVSFFIIRRSSNRT